MGLVLVYRYYICYLLMVTNHYIIYRYYRIVLYGLCVDGFIKEDDSLIFFWFLYENKISILAYNMDCLNLKLILRFFDNSLYCFTRYIHFNCRNVFCK